jgi:hypothetical protein
VSYNKSAFAFDDVQPAFDQALAAEKGIRIVCTSHSAAIILRSRFNYFRKLDREQNKVTYEKNHHLHGKSVYDKLILRVPPKGTPNEHCVYLEKRDISDLKIEELT